MIDFFVLIDDIINTQDCMTQKWHINAPQAEKHYKDMLMQNVMLNHMANFKLWHIEDIARKKDVDVKVIAKCKYEIDELNQQRTDYYESINDVFFDILNPYLQSNEEMPQNTETIGSVIDRLSILSLKIYHMKEELARRRVTDMDYASVTRKVSSLQQQKHDLVKAFKYSINEYLSGLKRPINYRQFKMYNDKNLNPELYHNDVNEYIAK